MNVIFRSSFDEFMGVISKESLEKWKELYPEAAENATYFAKKSEA